MSRWQVCPQPDTLFAVYHVSRPDDALWSFKALNKTSPKKTDNL